MYLPFYEPLYYHYVMILSKEHSHFLIICFLYRETEWLFATPEGRASLQSSVGFDRLAVITMHRDHTYPSLEQLQEELSEYILQIAPSGHHNRKVKSCNNLLLIFRL